MDHKNIIEVSPNKLAKTKTKLVVNGPKKLHVLADFDRTLTKAYVKGKKVTSLISVLRDHNYLTPEYPAKAKELLNKYHPIELDPQVPSGEKKKAMHEWWSKHFQLLIESGLSRKDIMDVIQSGVVEFRDGAVKLLDLLYEAQIPLVILSSSGLSGDAIELYLKQEQKMYENVYIVGNSFEWDSDGKATSIRKPIIHTLNKDETVIQELYFYNQIQDRTNVILLGDSEGDVRMIAGFSYDEIIRIGFFNDPERESLNEFKKLYDVIVTQDGPMDYVTGIVKEIINK